VRPSGRVVLTCVGKFVKHSALRSAFAADGVVQRLSGERIVYSLVGCSFVAVDATGVDLEQDINAVPGSSGDLGSRDAGVGP
jgi:hypothetical protein